MNTDESDRRLLDLVARAFVPRGVSHTQPDAVEAMLDAATGESLSDEQIERMLAKSAGKLPVGERIPEEEPAWSEVALTEEEQALVALHRSQGQSLPPAIIEKLKRYRDESRNKPPEGDRRGG